MIPKKNMSGNDNIKLYKTSYLIGTTERLQTEPTPGGATRQTDPEPVQTEHPQLGN